MSNIAWFAKNDQYHYEYDYSHNSEAAATVFGPSLDNNGVLPQVYGGTLTFAAGVIGYTGKNIVWSYTGAGDLTFPDQQTVKLFATFVDKNYNSLRGTFFLTATVDGVPAENRLVISADNSGYLWYPKVSWYVDSSPVPNFQADVLFGTAPLSVTFQDTSQGNPDTWSWDFGDSGTSSLQNPVHTYTSPGTYTVTLGVSKNGQPAVSTSKPDYIRVTAPAPIPSPAPGYRYDAITISGLSNIVTKDNTFKLRFTRNFTLRDDPEEYNLKNVHTEWSLMRPGQKTKIPEALWEKLIDSVAGVDAAGNVVPAIRRVLYDERNGTATQFGFGDEQTLAPSGLLASSIAYTIVNTTLIDDSGSTPVPDYISFLDLDQSASWFATPASARSVMTDIWNQAKVQQINEIFFAALNDVAASNYELTDIFKTSRLSAYSIKVVRAAPVKPLYE